jgi:hypothetical protein
LALNSSFFYYEAKHKFADFGIVTSGLKVDLEKMLGAKAKAVTGLTFPPVINFTPFKGSVSDWVKGHKMNYTAIKTHLLEE